MIKHLSKPRSDDSLRQLHNRQMCSEVNQPEMKIYRVSPKNVLIEQNHDLGALDPALSK